jgi:hypothetical protein
MIPRLHFFYAVILLIIPAFLQAQVQGNNVEWGDLTPSSGRLLSVLPRTSKDFFSLRWSGGPIMGMYRLAHHVDFKPSESGKVELRATNGMATYEDVQMLGKKVVVFLTDRFEGQHQLYLQVYGDDLKPEGESKLMASYSMDRGATRGTFKVVSSRDNQFAAVVWEIPGKREASDSYGFKVFDSELNIINSGEYKLPFEGQYSYINQHYLSNNGDYFISVSEFDPSSEKGLFRNYLNYKSMHIYQITTEGLEEFTINLEGKRVVAMDINSDNDKLLTLTGIYGAKENRGVSGLFFIRLDFVQKKMIDQGFREFGKDFITQNWTDRAKERADKRQQRGKGEPELYDYVMRQAEVLPDGSIVGSIEQYYVVISTFTDPRTGATRTSYTYYYNDIIAFKVGLSGDFEWLKRIGKYQVSTNDGGPFSSYARYIHNGKLCFIFNDNVKNYNEDGNFSAGDRIYPANFGKRKNVVAIAEVDIQTGDVTQHTFFERSEITALAVPKRFCIDYVNKDMLLYAIYGRKERFGIMKINP